MSQGVRGASWAPTFTGDDTAISQRPPSRNILRALPTMALILLIGKKGGEELKKREEKGKSSLFLL